MGTQLPLPKGAQTPIFAPYLLWPNGCMDQDATWCVGRPRTRPHCVRWGPSSPLKRGTAPSLRFSARVYCGQTAGWIEVPLDAKVGLGSGNIVLDADPAPSHFYGAQPPIFGPCLLWPNGWMDQDATWYMMVGLGSGHIVLHGDAAPTPKKEQSPQFSTHVYCGQTVAHRSYC